MSSSKIINFTVLGRRRIVYKVTASYDAPTDEVKQACMDAVLAFPAVLKEPTPTVYLSNYGASSIEYTIRCWTAADAYWDTYFKMEPFNNPLVRQAINYAIDRDSLNLVATNGYGEVTDSVMNKQINGYTDDVTHYEYDPEKAKELLAQAGYPDGFSTSMVVGTSARSTEAQIIQGNLAEIGINMEITTMESTTLLEQINNGDYEMFIMSYNNTTGDPDTSLYMLFIL